MPIDVNKLRDGVVVADGAWGTELDKRGVPAGYCREEWNISHPDEVEAVARAYVDAGSQIVLTNTFSANRFTLAGHGFADQDAAFTKAGAEISRRAAGDQAWVIGVIGPSGKMLLTEEVTEEQLYDAFKTQAAALIEAGVDAIICETMTELAEAVVALRACKETTALPVIMSFTYDSGPDRMHTMMGVSPQRAVEALADADAIGCNCGVGIDNYINVTRIYREATDKPIWVKANAGLPELRDGKVVYTESAESFASKVPALVKAGANIVGGCCGTDPTYIEAIRRALAM